MVHGQGALESMALSADFWRGKRVFMTGHTGFKGGWLALWLNSLGAKVFGFALPPATEPSLFDIARIGRAISHEVGDIRDLRQVRAAVSASRPDIVLHLAAQSLVRRSYAEPVDTYAANVMGTVHVLEVTRTEPSVRSIVIVTSDKCYENLERNHGYVESDRMGGRDPYSSSKGCAELVTAAYRASFFDVSTRAERAVGVASVRAGNVIGGGDWSEDRLVPDMYRAIRAGQPVSIRNPKAVRPWQHVLEPLCGYLLLAEKLFESGADLAEGWNFGPDQDDARSVAEVMELAVKRWPGLRWEPDSRSQPHEAKLLHLNSAKARTRLGWRPKMNVEQALEWTVDWYRASLEGKDMLDFSMQQISEYQRLGVS